MRDSHTFKKWMASHTTQWRRPIFLHAFRSSHALLDLTQTLSLVEVCYSIFKLMLFSALLRISGECGARGPWPTILKLHLPPCPTSINTSTSSALFCFLPKNSHGSVCLFWLCLSSELISSQNLFSLVVFHGTRVRFTLPTSTSYRALQNWRGRMGNRHLRIGSCFMSMKKMKNQCFKMGETLSLFSQF